MSRHSALVNTLAVVMAHVLDFGFVIAGVFRYLLSVVVECPDLLLMFSLFVTDKEFYTVCWTLPRCLLASWLLMVELYLVTQLPQCLPARWIFHSVTRLLEYFPASWILMVGLHSMTQ